MRHPVENDEENMEGIESANTVGESPEEDAEEKLFTVLHHHCHRDDDFYQLPTAFNFQTIPLFDKVGAVMTP